MMSEAAGVLTNIVAFPYRFRARISTMHPLYRILKHSPAKRGANGTVWHARDEVLGRDVALKELRNWTARPARATACFHFAHIRRLTLSNAGLVCVQGADCDRGWLVLDYSPQGSLAATPDPLPPTRLRQVLAEVLQTLKFLHEAGFVHAAIKPTNLFACENGSILLSDGFGLRRGDNGKALGAGALFQGLDSIESKYLAPECLDGRYDQVGPSIDLYALGLTAVELLLGEEAFVAQFPLIQLAAQSWSEWHRSAATLAPLGELCPDVPADLKELIDRLIRKDSKERPTLEEALAIVAPRRESSPRPMETRPSPPPPPAPVIVADQPAVRVMECPSIGSRLREFAKKPVTAAALSGLILGAGMTSIRRGESRLTTQNINQVRLRPALAVHEPTPPTSPVVSVDPRVEPLQRERDALIEQLERSKTEQTQLQTSIKQLSDDLSDARAERDQARAATRSQAEQTAAELKSAREAVVRTQSQLKSIATDYSRALDDLKKLRIENERIREDADQQRAMVAAVTSDLKETRAELTRTRTRFEEVRMQLASRTSAPPPTERVLLAPADDAQVMAIVATALRALGAKVAIDSTKPQQPVTMVDLTGSPISADILGLLQRLPNLKALSLASTAITDDGLRCLQQLSRLESLGLHDTQISDAGLVHLSGLSELQTLYLGSTRITDAGLIHLRGLTNIRTLYLAHNRIGDAGLAQLRGLTRLENLHLTRTDVTDAALAHLAGLKDLQYLFLSYTSIGDAGLTHLNGLTKLKEINLASTRVTASGIAELRRSLPGCRVQHDSSWPASSLPR